MFPVLYQCQTSTTESVVLRRGLYLKSRSMFHQIKLVQVSAEEADGKLINNLDLNRSEKIYVKWNVFHEEGGAICAVERNFCNPWTKRTATCMFRIEPDSAVFTSDEPTGAGLDQTVFKVKIQLNCWHEVIDSDTQVLLFPFSSKYHLPDHLLDCSHCLGFFLASLLI